MSGRAMRPIGEIPFEARARVEWVFTDIDDTLTTEGQLPAVAYAALWRLHDAGIGIVPVTGRPAGWCDHIARMWPVVGIVGENGGLALRYDRATRRMLALHAQTPEERAAHRERLSAIRRRILAEVPGAGIASDQAYRLYDLAIDFREDVPPLSDREIDRIVRIFESAGATAKVSSIHVNGWFGTFDKLQMIERFADTQLGLDLRTAEGQARAVYVGDSPNDEPAFAFFRNSVGVANVVDMAQRLRHPPAFIAPSRGGAGFAELADILLSRGD